MQTRQIFKRRIATEQLVPAKTRQCNRHAAASCRLAGIPRINSVAGGLVEAGQNAGKIRRDPGAGDQLLVMFRAECPGGELGAGLFGESTFVEDQRKCFQPGRATFNHEPDHRRGVHPARKKRADRHIRDPVGADGILQLIAQTVNEIGIGRRDLARAPGRRKMPPGCR